MKFKQKRSKTKARGDKPDKGKIAGQGGTSSPYPHQTKVPMGPGADVPGKMPHPVQLPKLRSQGKGKR
jgi:hypothetical protein